MYLTQDEAKTKWCPQARVISATVVSGIAYLTPAIPPHNRVQEPAATEATLHASHMCIASECAMWNWVMKTQHGSGAGLAPEGGYSWDTGNRGGFVSDPPAGARGYCGLARGSK